MTRKDRALAAVRGELPDRAPAAFWLHFPASMHHGTEAVQAHLRFYEETETDILKVMNENLLPRQPLATASDWRHIRPLRLDEPFVADQLDITKAIADAVGDEAVVIATIHGVFASAFHTAFGREDYEQKRAGLVAHYREAPEAVKAGFRAIAEGLAAFTQASLDAGAQGIYYAALGGEQTLFTGEEFAELLEPLDRAVLDAASGASAFNILHICKDHVDLTRYASYRPQVVNWAVHEANPPLSEGRELFPESTLLGGLDDRAGVLVTGSDEEIDAAVAATIEQLGPRRLILGADCTLPTDIDYRRIRQAVRATARRPFTSGA